MIGNVLAENEWELSRLGKITASKIDALFTEPKLKADKEAGELSDTAKTYILSRASEIMTGTIRKVQNWAMEWGNQYEPEAAFELRKLYPNIEYLGKENPIFFKYSDFSGGSPDAVERIAKIVGEIKCPEDPTNHVKYCLLKSAAELKKAERDYYHQIQFNMACVAKELGCSFFDMKGVFITYCPLVNDPYPKAKTLDIYPDKEFYDKLDLTIERAENYLASIIMDLRQPSILLAQYDTDSKTILIDAA